MEKLLQTHDVNTPVRMVLYKWKLLGIIKETEKGRKGGKNKLQSINFKKVKV